MKRKRLSARPRGHGAPTPICRAATLSNKNAWNPHAEGTFTRMQAETVVSISGRRAKRAETVMGISDRRAKRAETVVSICDWRAKRAETVVSICDWRAKRRWRKVQHDWGELTHRLKRLRRTPESVASAHSMCRVSRNSVLRRSRILPFCETNETSLNLFNYKVV